MRKSKYNAIRTGAYASKAESERAGKLKLLLHAGIIRCLVEHPRFEIIPKSRHGRALHYTADFAYEEKNDAGAWNQIVEDVKGSRFVVSRDFPLRTRLFRERYGDTHELRIVEKQ